MKNIKFLKENGVDIDKSLELFNDIDIYNTTMKDFLDGIDIKIMRLKKYYEDDDLPNYAIFAHSIKSDARYLGFTTVAEVALKHEMAGKENNQHFILSDYDNFINIVNDMINVVRRYLNEEPDVEIRLLNVRDSAKKTILIADDSPLIVNLITKVLKNDYNIIVAENGEIVKNKINNIDVLLLDLNMPVIDGFGVLEYMKENNLFEKVNVSIITGDESKETIQRAFEYPIVDMLTKPFSIEELSRVVEKTVKFKL